MILQEWLEKVEYELPLIKIGALTTTSDTTFVQIDGPLSFSENVPFCNASSDFISLVKKRMIEHFKTLLIYHEGMAETIAKLLTDVD